MKFVFAKGTGETGGPTAGRRLVGALPQVLLAILLACLLFQGTAVQTHIHFTGGTPWAASASGGQVIQTAPSGSGEDAAGCPLCQEMATAGAYLLPSAIVLPPPPEELVWRAAATIGAFSLLTPARGWQSRAPPE